MTDDVELRRLATRRADMKLAFRSHLIAYVIVNAGLVTINLITSSGYFWAIWPIIGWGIGLAAHAVTVYMDAEGARDRLIQQELEKLRKTRG
jgi:2TM domain-containing protein